MNTPKTDYRKRLYDAVVNQLGCCAAELPGLFKDVAEHGADAGWSGFTYYSDTLAFYARNQEDIVALLEEFADELGENGAVSLVESFVCLRGLKLSKNAIARAIYAPYRADKNNGEEVDTIANALAWFALEEVDTIANALAWFALEETARRATEEEEN